MTAGDRLGACSIPCILATSRIRLSMSNFQDRRVDDILEQAVCWDNHVCLPLEANDDTLPQLERFRAAGFTAVTVNIGYSEAPGGDHGLIARHFTRWIHENGDRFMLLRHATDLSVAKRTGRLAVAFDIEGVAALEGDLARIQDFYDLGVRWMLLAYNTRSQAGCGCHVDDDGLTDFGRAVIREMERVGMVVCCSHAGARTARDILDYACRPVLFSHSNPRALCDHPRNIDDTLIDACAKTGGIVGINGVSLFLGTQDVSATAIVRAIDHVAGRVGVEHVALGLDYPFMTDTSDLQDIIAANPEAFPPALGYGGTMTFAPPEILPRIVDSLCDLSYSDADILKILGGNLARLAASLWR
ncbi:dipeptidase [Gluconacetobacter sp. Hr-1-5]|uniref:dipeptidase n=1 Tax=Gluconacetobacter sp. Hr-1-5 TaxID=3395370 RepID=UPI003B52BCE5